MPNRNVPQEGTIKRLQLDADRFAVKEPEQRMAGATAAPMDRTLREGL